MQTRLVLLAFAMTCVLAPGFAKAGANGPLRPAAEPIVLKFDRDPQWSATGFDPVPVLFSAGACESNLLELELWSRDLEEWVPHPRHPRLVTGGCAVEDAGKLLNEIRIRCADPEGRRRPSAWRVGANVWRPIENSACSADAAQLPPLRISITSPGPGDVIRAERGFTTLRGSIEAGAPAGEAESSQNQSEVSLADIDRVRIDNLSTGEFSENVFLKSNGQFSGPAPVVAGINHLRVSVVGLDGRFGSADLEVEFRAPDEREELLAAEREHMRRMRAQKQKSLELSVEPEPSSDGRRDPNR